MTNFSDMLSKAKAMQEKMREVQDQIKKIEVQGMSGGNLVKVTMTGDYEIKSIEITEKAKSENQEIIYAVPSYESFKTGKLVLDGNERFYERDASYFRLLQPLNCGLKIPTKHIYMYSFSLDSKEFQPSGTCNFSRIDNIKLVFTSGYNYGLNISYTYIFN